MAAEKEIPLPVLIRYFRVPTGGIPVDYPGREVLLTSRITNLSVNGVFVRTARPLPEGTELEIAFRLPGTQRMIQALTVVRWRTARGAAEILGEASGMGLEFKTISRVDQKAIEKHVRDFLLRMRAATRV